MRDVFRTMLLREKVEDYFLFYAYEKLAVMPEFSRDDEEDCEQYSSFFIPDFPRDFLDRTVYREADRLARENDFRLIVVQLLPTDKKRSPQLVIHFYYERPFYPRWFVSTEKDAF